MMPFRSLLTWMLQILLFTIGMGTAGLAAHLLGPVFAEAFRIDELIPTALVFFAAAGILGWISNSFWPEDWLYNPLL